MVVYYYRYIIQFLTLVLVALVITAFQIPDSNLHIIACDVGQGDAILVIYKNIQILTDGGPDNTVTNCLSHYMPFWDREIELVISTHPDADHSTGLVEVLKRYKVDRVMINSLDPGTQVYKALKKQIGGHAIPSIQPIAGMGMRVGMIQLDIFNPPQDFVSKATNEYSVVYRLDFGNFKALMPGDISSSISDKLAEENEIGPVNYIKVPHHGSNDGLTDNLLKVLMPRIAVISVGKNNLFGHPTPQIIKMLTDENIKTYRTDQVGNIELVTDGEEYWMKK